MRKSRHRGEFLSRLYIPGKYFTECVQGLLMFLKTV